MNPNYSHINNKRVNINTDDDDDRDADGNDENTAMVPPQHVTFIGEQRIASSDGNGGKAHIDMETSTAPVSTLEVLNLIGKMVPKDVSTMDERRTEAGGGNGFAILVGGFPAKSKIDESYCIEARTLTTATTRSTGTSHVLSALTTITTTTATINKIYTRPARQPITTTTATTTATATTNISTKSGNETIPTITSDNNVGGSIKSKSSENKYSSDFSKKLSNQRLTEPSRPTGPGDCDCEQKQQSIVNASEYLTFKGLLTLSEKKRKLKEDFFKDCHEISKEKYHTRRKKKLNNIKLWIHAPKDHKEGVQIDGEQYAHKRATTEGESSVLATEDRLPLVVLRKLQLEQRLQRTFIGNSHTRQDPSKTIAYIVPALVKKFDRNSRRVSLARPHSLTMIVSPNKDSSEMNTLKPTAELLLDQRNSPLSDEGCNLGQSPYSSDNEDNDSNRISSSTIERSKRKDRVGRSASSDSALGLEIDDTIENPQQLLAQRRMTLTVTDLPLRPALLPLAEPTALLDSPPSETIAQSLLVQTAVPSKVLLEERVIGIPESVQSVATTTTATATSGLCSLSRRESSQSCGSDFMPSECAAGVRFVRTPSVVVSDYSDDVLCGITLEEIEYFRAQRLRRRRSSLDTAGTEKETDGHSDVSASSSCSNLYYCGSTISALDGAECLMNGIRIPLERKTSDCSSCGDEEQPTASSANTFTIPEQPEDAGHLADMLAAQHLGGSAKRVKKVGLMVPPAIESPDL